MTGLLGIVGSGDTLGGAMVQGDCLLTNLFGANSGTIADAVSAYAGIKPSSAKTLLGTAGVVVPALLGQYASSHNLKAIGTAWLLVGLKGQVRSLLPAGLHGLTGVLRLGRLGNWAAPAANGRLAASRVAPTVAGGLRTWWYHLLVPFIAFVLVRYFLLVWGLPATDVASPTGGSRASAGSFASSEAATGIGLRG